MYTVEDIKAKLIKYCTYQERSNYDVEQKLREFYFLSEDEKGEVIIYLIQENFINEERFARSYTRGKFQNNKWGRNKIKYHLKQKQVPSKIIELSLQEIDEDEYINLASKLAEKHISSLTSKNIFERNKKIYAYLYQKGFESEIIYDILR